MPWWHDRVRWCGWAAVSIGRYVTFSPRKRTGQCWWWPSASPRSPRSSSGTATAISFIPPTLAWRRRTTSPTGAGRLPGSESGLRALLRSAAGTLPADRGDRRALRRRALRGGPPWLRRVDEDEPIGVLFSGGVGLGRGAAGALPRCSRPGRARRGSRPSPWRSTAAAAMPSRRASSCARSTSRCWAKTVEVRPARRPAGRGRADRGLQGARRRVRRRRHGAARRCAALPRLALLVDGDGGDENLKDYPIEENPELTIVSVVNNSMLYQEGWGVESIKHSLTYSGGYSRGCVRTYAPASATASRLQSLHLSGGDRGGRGDPVQGARPRGRTSGSTRSRATWCGAGIAAGDGPRDAGLREAALPGGGGPRLVFRRHLCRAARSATATTGIGATSLRERRRCER